MLSTPNHKPSLVWTIVGIGMLLRLIWVVLMPVAPVSDSIAYDTLARNLLQNGVYGWSVDEPSAYWAVGTSAIAAATYYVLGESYWGIVALNLLASLLTMWLTYRLAHIHFGEAAAFWALAIITFWPNLIFFTSILSSELYFIALTLLGFNFWSREGRNGLLSIILCGLVWGLACYLRPVILLLPAALLIAALSQGLRATGIAAVKCGVTICLILIVVAPWTARNQEVMGKAYLVSSNFGTNLWMGNNPDSTGGYMPLPDDVADMSEVDREEHLAAIAKEYIRNDIPGFVQNLLGRIVTLHNRETIGVVWNEAAITNIGGANAVLGSKLLATGYWYALLITALTGLGIAFKHLGFAALFHPVFGTWAYFTAVHAIIVVEDRYHMPSSPFIAMFAGLSLAWLVAKFRGQVPSETLLQRQPT